MPKFAVISPTHITGKKKEAADNISENKINLLLENASKQRWFNKVHKEFFILICRKILSLSPRIGLEVTTRGISCVTDIGDPRKFLAVQCYSPFIFMFFSLNNKERIYPEGPKPEIKNRRKIENSKKILPNEDLTEIMKLVEKCYRLSVEQLGESNIFVKNKYSKEDSVIEDKIARICWNDYGWQRPSGREGKSTNEKSYEYKVGYGHEEWLLDAEKLIDGYHYGYLQPVADAWPKYQGKVFNISLYSINKETSERWWIGKINNAQVVSSDESKKAYAYYKEKGWFYEMIEQIKSVKGDEKDFLNNAPIAFVNIKFRLQDWQLLDPPQRISNKDKVISAAYYVLLNKTKEPDLELPFGDDPDFTPDHTVRNEQGVAHYGQRKTEIDRFHSKMQNSVYKQLVKIHGNNNVRTERPIGIGLAVDLSVKDGFGEIFYEFKTSNSVRTCIREALSQLLEYSYYPNKERAKKLIIVSQNPINKQAKDYLSKIRSQFNIPVYYKKYDTNKNCLEEIEY